MPAKSKAQQKLFGIAHAVQQGKMPASKVSNPAKDIAKNVKKKEVKKFATTPTKGLPDRVKKEMKEVIRELVKEFLNESLTSRLHKIELMNATKDEIAKMKSNIKAKGYEFDHVEKHGDNSHIYFWGPDQSLSKNDYLSIGGVGDRVKHAGRMLNIPGKKVTRESKLNEARSIGASNIKKLKLLTTQLWKYNNHVREEQVIERVPVEWWDIWEGADGEIRQIVDDTLMKLDDKLSSGDMYESKLNEGNKCSICGKPSKEDTEGNPKYCQGHSQSDILKMRKEKEKKSQLEIYEAKTGRPMSVFDKHELAIAYKTLNMPDAMVGVMGGPTKDQAKQSIKRITGKDYKERTESVNEATEPTVNTGVRVIAKTPELEKIGIKKPYANEFPGMTGKITKITNDKIVVAISFKGFEFPRKGWEKYLSVLPAPKKESVTEETHAEHSKKAGVSTPCSASSITFGGKCLNCGWEPKKQTEGAEIPKKKCKYCGMMRPSYLIASHEKSCEKNPKKSVTEEKGWNKDTPCPECKSTKKDIYKVDTHSDVYCAKCGYLFGTSKSMKEGIYKNPNGRRLPPPKGYQCSDCGKKFSRAVPQCTNCGSSNIGGLTESTVTEGITYVAIYNGKEISINNATSLYDAKKKAIERFKPAKSKEHMISVMPAEKDGKPIVHVATEGFKKDAGVPVKEQYKFNPEYSWLKKMAQQKTYNIGPVTITLAFDPAKKILAINAMMATNDSHKAEDAPRHIEAALDSITGMKETIFHLDKIAPHKDKTSTSSVQKLWLLPADKISTWGAQNEATNKNGYPWTLATEPPNRFLVYNQKTGRLVVMGLGADGKKRALAWIEKNNKRNESVNESSMSEVDVWWQDLTYENKLKVLRKLLKMPPPAGVVHYKIPSLTQMKPTDSQKIVKFYADYIKQGVNKPFPLKNENGDIWYLRYIDPTHFYASISPDKEGTPYHIGQMDDHPNLSKQFVAKIRAWLAQQSKQHGR